MKAFENKVAVITGAANGIGHALAKEAAKRKMKLVITDIDETNLQKLADTLIAEGTEVLSLVSDATEYDQVEDVAKKTIERFGQVDLLVNNAGVVVEGKIWEIPVNDMDYITQSNLYSVMYGLKAFIPIMLEQDTECHIVNVASVAGLVSSPTMPTYHMTKFGNVGLSESVSYQLQSIKSKIKMSVYCPGFIQTDLHNCDSRRTGKFALNDDPYYKSPEYAAGQKYGKFVIETGLPIDSVGMSVFQGIEDENFYILTHPNYTPLIGLRVKNVLDGHNPDIALFKQQ
ncbi:SDR family NAD(P)-dependent oxidoreductase [Fusibacter sp. JL298sf-3]